MRQLFLAAPVLIACASRHALEQSPIVNKGEVRADRPALVIERSECYALTYSDARNGASGRYFPVWIALLPGKHDALAEGKHDPSLSDAQWAVISQFRGWRQISADSIQVQFTGTMEGVEIRVRRNGANIEGRAVLLTDLVNLPEESMRVIGTRENCPSEILPAKSG